ncbi:hypothetical protein CQW23_20748 [Capsicum baccatum]|uniref:SWIM-type domain-containing protein n=1 Tax=Capsicum baccatum TaxID=33114 RepID=A0A2G2W9I6_CAPBA|nr:hypothetical protein CQW23_20748 [Capsicum baccatum]
MTSNITESLNSMLRDEKEYPVVAIFNSIANRFGEIFRKRYADVDNSKTTFVSVVETILRENMIEGDKLYVNNINGSTDEFTVLGYGCSTKVNLSRRSCSCRKYDLVKLPCAHAMVALCLKHGNEYDTSIYNYSSQIYSKESYLLAYLEPICAAPVESEWSVAQEYLEMQVLSPDFYPKLGRRKVKHVKGVLEPSRNSGQKFYSCAVGKDNGECSYFKWIFSDFEVSKFQGIAKFEMFERLRDSEENRNLLMILYRESEHKIDHLKGLLKDVEIERDQFKHKLAMAEENEKGMKFMVYDLLLI